MAHQFYDVDVRTDRGKGEDSPGTMAERAETLGFTGIILADTVQGAEDMERTQEAVDALDTPLDIRVGARIRAQTGSDLKEQLRAVRDHADAVVVHGGNPDVNRAATGDTRVDMLAHPGRGRKDAGIDHVMAKQAAENRVALGITLRPLLHATRRERAHHLSNLRELVRLAQHFDTPVTVGSGARTRLELRAPRELAAVPSILGMAKKASFSTVTDVPQRFLARADRVNDESTVRPGVAIEGGERDG